MVFNINNFFDNRNRKSKIADFQDLDHLDGDHHNNTPSNVKTYCKLCHGRKSLINGDCNSNKASTRRMV